MSFYNVIKLTEHEGRALLVIRGTDDKPMISVYCEHEGQTLMRPCPPSIENMNWALNILKDGE